MCFSLLATIIRVMRFLEFRQDQYHDAGAREENIFPVQDVKDRRCQQNEQPPAQNVKYPA